MTFLVLLVCLSGAPDRCQSELVPLLFAETSECLVTAPMAVDMWMDEHRGWSLRGCGCRSPDDREA